jgi:cytoskeleton protein RodZ
MTLDDISVSTKIGTRFLAALEGDHFDQLPGGIFNKGFVRAYARHLGLDENQAIVDFVAASAPSLPETQPEDAPVLAAMAVRVPESKRKSSGNDGIPWGVFAVVLLVLAGGFAVWGFHSREKSTQSTAVPPSVQTETSTAGTEKAAPEQAPIVQPATTTSSASQASPPGSSAIAPENGAPATAAAANPGVFVVVIKARQDSWVSVTADGNQVMQDTLNAAGEKSVQARNQIVVKTGNVGALDISFNGKMLASQGGYNQVKTLTFDSTGLRP